jgi:hypothetical protein
MTRRRTVPVTLALVAVFAGTTACARSLLTPPEPRLVGSRWVLHELPEAGLLVSTPPTFHAVDERGCFQGHAQDTLPYGAGWRAFCLGLHPLDESIPLFIEGPRPPDCRADCILLEEVRTTRMTLGGQDVIVQTAYQSGGFAGRPRSPEMLIQIPIPRGLALLRAQYGDRDDAAIILGIAQTISTR